MYNEKQMWAYRAPDDPPTSPPEPKTEPPKEEPKPKTDPPVDKDNATIKQMREDFKTQKTLLTDATKQLQDIERDKLAEIDRLKLEKEDLTEKAKENSTAAEERDALTENLEGLVEKAIEALPEEKRDMCKEFIGAAPLGKQLAAIEAFASNIPKPQAIGKGGKGPEGEHPTEDPNKTTDNGVPEGGFKLKLENNQMPFEKYTQADFDRSKHGGLSTEALEEMLDKVLEKREKAAKK